MRWSLRWSRRLASGARGRGTRSIQFVITVSFTLMTVLVMLLIGVILYNKFARTAEQNAVLSDSQIVEQVNYNVEIYLQGMADLFGQLASRLEGDAETTQERLREQLDTILHTRADLVSLSIVDKAGEPLLNLPDRPIRAGSRVKEQAWFQSALENPNHLTFSVPHVQNLFKGEYRWVVSMSKTVAVRRGGQATEAVLLVDINFKTLDQLLQRVSLGKKGYVYVIDESAGNLIYHPQQQLIYSGLKYENVEQALKYTYGSYVDDSTGERRLITIKTVAGIGWKVIGVSYMDEIVTTQKELIGFISWLLLFLLAFVLIISAYLSARISRPIKRLERSMRKVEQGDFDIHLPVTGDDEVGRLSRRFNLMVGRIGELMTQIIAEQEAKRKNELEVLQAQIHPHFLYNTLNSVVRMAGGGKTDEVVTMITSLSKFFRISLSRGKHIITVKEELEHVRNYLVIQKIRYKNKFEYVIEAEPEALDCLTLKLVLQPLVENAIYHGIEQMADIGLIRVTAAISQGRLRLRVADNGLGIAPARLASLLSCDGGKGEGSGVGLRNVHERVRLYFGPEFGLEMESEQEEGTTVTVWLPLRREEEATGE